MSMKTNDKYKKSLSLLNAAGTGGLGEASAKAWPRVLAVARRELNEKTTAEEGKALALEAWGGHVAIGCGVAQASPWDGNDQRSGGFPRGIGVKARAYPSSAACRSEEMVDAVAWANMRWGFGLTAATMAIHVKLSPDVAGVATPLIPAFGASGCSPLMFNACSASGKPKLWAGRVGSLRKNLKRATGFRSMAPQHSRYLLRSVVAGLGPRDVHQRCQSG
jgi:hypothetical protein